MQLGTRASEIPFQDPNASQSHLQFGTTWWQRQTLAWLSIGTILVGWKLRIAVVIPGISSWLSSALLAHSGARGMREYLVCGTRGKVPLCVRTPRAHAHVHTQEHQQSRVCTQTHSKNRSCPHLRTGAGERSQFLIMSKFTLLRDTSAWDFSAPVAAEMLTLGCVYLLGFCNDCSLGWPHPGELFIILRIQFLFNHLLEKKRLNHLFAPLGGTRFFFRILGTSEQLSMSL